MSDAWQVGSCLAKTGTARNGRCRMTEQKAVLVVVLSLHLVHHPFRGVPFFVAESTDSLNAQ